MSSTPSTASGRLAMLMSLLDSDPNNPVLLADAAGQALEEAEPAKALELLERRAQIQTPGPAEHNLTGLALLQTRDFAGASAAFEELVDGGVDDPSVLFNFAWSLAALKEQDRALFVLDERVTDALPQAAMLELQLLHDRGQFELAGERMRHHLQRHRDHAGLNAAASVLALDVDDPILAEETALRAGDHPDALATLATLALEQGRTADAERQFDAALARSDHVPRAWVGRGLSRLLSDDLSGACSDLDRGAELFKDHADSWNVAGWARLLQGESEAAKVRFNKALEADPRHAETLGSLAVVDLMENRPEDAREHADRALDHDSECVSAALALSLLEGGGEPAELHAALQRALNTQLGDDGQTLGQMIARLSRR